jgi:hypothetical protein
MAGSKTHLIENAREMLLSTDITRIGKLAAREQQSADRAKALRADFYLPGSFDDFSASGRLANFQAIPGALSAPSLEGQTGTFDMVLGPGETECDTTDLADPDVSPHQVARWDQQTISWPLDAYPDGAAPKIATICVEPTDAQTDAVSRNILLDPASRSFAPQTVYKTSNPSGTIFVVAGAAAAVPLPPALPSNCVALFDVFMFPGTTQSSDFQITRRGWRRIEFPGSSQHGIVKGCTPEWDTTDETSGSPAYIPLGYVPHRLVIDGELLTFGSPAAGGFVVATPDTNNPPGSAPPTNDLPTYLYLCGGRWFPWCGGIAGSVPYPYNAAPVVLVESLTPPDRMGYPTAAMAVAGATIPRNGALFVGNGFLVINSSVHKCCRIDGDWIHALTMNSALVPSVLPNACFNESLTTLLTGPGQDVAVTTMPANATMADFELLGFFSPYGGGAEIRVFQEALSASPDLQVARAIEVVNSAGGGQALMSWRGAIPAGGLFFVINDSFALSASIMLYARAYNMNLPRLAR